MKKPFFLAAIFALAFSAHAGGTNATAVVTLTNTNGWHLITNAAPQAIFTVAARDLSSGTLSPIVHRVVDDEDSIKKLCAYQMKKNRTSGVEWVIVCPNGDVWRKAISP